MLNPVSAWIGFTRQNLMSIDIRFWHLESFPTLKGLSMWNYTIFYLLKFYAKCCFLCINAELANLYIVNWQWSLSYNVTKYFRIATNQQTGICLDRTLGNLKTGGMMIMWKCHVPMGANIRYMTRFLCEVVRITWLNHIEFSFAPDRDNNFNTVLNYFDYWLFSKSLFCRGEHQSSILWKYARLDKTSADIVTHWMCHT